jgi:anaerobic selenocysteine-containing dehydrogenase
VPVAKLEAGSEDARREQAGRAALRDGHHAAHVGVQNVMSCANLQMLLGNMGVPGGGVNPLRGQNNVQGACDMGGLPNYYTGYQTVADAAPSRSSRRPGACRCPAGSA